jgi:hypothetical protein
MPAWNVRLSARELFERIELAEVSCDLAESAFQMRIEKPDSSLADNPGLYAWSEAHLQRAYLEYYQVARESRWLIKLLDRFDRLLTLRDDRFGRVDTLRRRVMPAWGSGRFSGGQYTCWLVHAGMILYPATRAARLIMQDESLRSTLINRADAIVAAVHETLSAYDTHWHDGPGADEGYYDEPASSYGHLPLNQQNIFGRLLLELGALGDVRACDRAGRLANFMKRRLVVRSTSAGDAYVWQYCPPLAPPFDPALGKGEDVSHAGMNVDFAVLCRRENVVFDDEDLRRMARTFLHIMRRPDGAIADRVDGSGDPQPGRAEAVAMWAQLGQVDRDVARVVRDYYFAQNPPINPPFGLLALALLARHEY